MSESQGRHGGRTTGEPVYDLANDPHAGRGRTTGLLIVYSKACCLTWLESTSSRGSPVLTSSVWHSARSTWPATSMLSSAATPRRRAGLLYDKLETVVLPLSYSEAARWRATMKQSIGYRLLQQPGDDPAFTQRGISSVTGRGRSSTRGAKSTRPARATSPARDDKCPAGIPAPRPPPAPSAGC
jgi:hypothetical protein